MNPFDTAQAAAARTPENPAHSERQNPAKPVAYEKPPLVERSDWNWDWFGNPPELLAWSAAAAQTSSDPHFIEDHLRPDLGDGALLGDVVPDPSCPPA